MMSTAAPVLVDPPLAPRAGEDLRAARERLDWPLEAVAAELRIRLSYLQALEAGHISILPGHAYALGFLRTYARALGLDPEEMVRRFKAEAGEVSRQTELAFPAPMPERGLPAGAVALLGLLLVVGAYVGWYRLSGEGRLPAETVTAVPARLAPLAEQAVPPVVAPPPPVVAAVAPPPVSTEPAAVMPSISPSSAAAAPVNPLPVVQPPAAPPAPVVALPDPDAPRIMLRARADAWVRVRDRSGPVLIDRILHAGDTLSVPLKPNLVLSLGNAGGTDILVDGVLTPSLGGNGAVVKDLPADPDLLKDGKALPAVVPLRVSAPVPVVARPQ
jgi:cytoskeleton protein RodZ